MDLTTVVRSATNRLDSTLGGAQRRRVIVVLASVLALDSADKATIGTSATQLEAGLHIGRTDIGLLLTVSSLVGAVAAVPFGMLVDRVDRTRLLAGCVVLWGVAMGISGLATGFLFLLLSRVALGAVVGVAAPAIASLIGDYFPQAERGRIYGFVLSGELVGAGIGFLVTGQFAILSWRAPFFVLVLPSAVVWLLLRRLPEPERGGAGRLAPEGQDDEDSQSSSDGLAHEQVRDHDIPASERGVLEQHPRELSVWEVTRYVLSVRTNVALIVASALGYFFFSGVRGFAIEFAKSHYRVGQGTATSLTVLLGVGALAGVMVGGRLADRMLARGRLSARTVVPGVAVLAAAAVFVPALTATSLLVAVPALTVAALFLGAANPPLDAARLDIIHPGAWGRAEAVRTVLRSCGDAAAPLVFGVLADSVFGGRSGLEYTFLLMLGSLVAAAAVNLLVARRSYPNDVAAAARSLERVGP